MSMDDKTSGWENIIRADFRVINPTCARCPEDAVNICVTQMADGDIWVTTLCDRCTEGSIEHSVKKEGFVQDGRRCTFFNPKVLSRVQALSSDQKKDLAKKVMEVAGVEVQDFREEQDDESTTPSDV